MSPHLPDFPSLPSIHRRNPHGSAPSGLPGTPRSRAARTAWRCQGEKVDASWRRLAGRRRSHTAAPVHPPRVADGGKRHLGDGDAAGPGGRFFREKTGRRPKTARSLVCGEAPPWGGEVERGRGPMGTRGRRRAQTVDSGRGSGQRCHMAVATAEAGLGTD